MGRLYLCYFTVIQVRGNHRFFFSVQNVLGSKGNEAYVAFICAESFVERDNFKCEYRRDGPDRELPVRG